MRKGRTTAKWFLLMLATGTLLPLGMCGIDVNSMLYKYAVNSLSSALTGAV
jgi:hypothetical protein